MFEFVFVIIFLSVPIFILLGAIKNKFADAYNPCKWNNSNNRHIEVKNIKTRNIFQKK